MNVRDLFPLTHRHLGSAAPVAKSPEEFVAAVCAAYARGDIPCRGARDLVHYEAHLHALPKEPMRPAGPRPRDDERVVLSPHVRVLIYGADLPNMLAALREGKPADPKPARGWLVVARDAHGAIREILLVRMEGWLLESFREPTPPSEAVEDDEDRALFAHLWEDGILVRAP